MSVLLFALLAVCLSKTIYVDSSRPSGGDGTSWNKAFNNLQLGLSAAGTSTNTKIWVAGNHTPSLSYGGGYSGTEINLRTFKLNNNNILYGGFAGTEVSETQRNINVNPTILDGDLLKDGNRDNFAWHVVTIDGAVNVIMDGFVIKNGYAAGPDAGVVISVDHGIGTTSNISSIGSIDYAHTIGSGLVVRNRAKVLLNNMVFVNNSANCTRATIVTLAQPVVSLASGGALGIADAGTSVVVSNSHFTDNVLSMIGTNGGAINVIKDGSLTVMGCTFTRNKGNGNGGAIHVRNARQVNAINSVFNNNEVTGNIALGTGLGNEAGSAIGYFNSNGFILGCSFNSNKLSAGAGGTIFFHTPFDDNKAYKLSIVNSNFNNNIGGNLGGAITIFGIIPNINTNAELISCNFNNNTGGVGGGVYVDSIKTRILSCDFDNNNARVSGGAIFAANFGTGIFNFTRLSTRSKLSITSSSFNNNFIAGSLPTDGSPTSVLGFLASFITAGNASVTSIPVGGAAIASEFGAQVNIISSSFNFNNASLGIGGALLVGGGLGSVGGTPYGLNQAYLTILASTAYGNVDQNGYNNVVRSDLLSLGNNINGVYFSTDGSVV